MTMTTNEHPMPASPLPWKWADGWDGDDLPASNEEFSGGKYVDCQLSDAEGHDVIPLRIDHYERIWDTSAEDGLRPCDEDRAYIEWACNNAPSLAAENARLRAALEEIAQDNKIAGGSLGPLFDAGFGTGWDMARDAARAALEAK